MINEREFILSVNVILARCIQQFINAHVVQKEVPARWRLTYLNN